jgi:hypothetical protein
MSARLPGTRTYKIAIFRVTQFIVSAKTINQFQLDLIQHFWSDMFNCSQLNSTVLVFSHPRQVSFLHITPKVKIIWAVMEAARTSETLVNFY